MKHSRRKIPTQGSIYAEFRRAAGKAFGDVRPTIEMRSITETNKKYFMHEVKTKSKRMKPVLIPFCCLLAIMLYSCKSKSDEPDTLESLSKLKEFSENIVKEAEKSTSRWEERKAKGDTIAMPYKDLQAYLPEISGYTSENGPKGSQTNTPGLGSWSQGEQEYVNGDKRVEVSIMDYNAAHQAFSGLTAMYGLGMSTEDDEKRQGPVDLGIKNVAAYETIYKKEKRSEITLIVGDRFIINLQSEGENDESFLRSVAKNMKLDELANK